MRRIERWLPAEKRVFPVRLRQGIDPDGVLAWDGPPCTRACSVALPTPRPITSTSNQWPLIKAPFSMLLGVVPMGYWERWYSILTWRRDDEHPKGWRIAYKEIIIDWSHETIWSKLIYLIPFIYCDKQDRNLFTWGLWYIASASYSCLSSLDPTMLQVCTM